MVYPVLIQDDYLLYWGPVDNRSVVSHQALALVMSASTGLTLSTPTHRFLNIQGALLASLAPHQLRSEEKPVLLLMFDPQSNLARGLKQKYALQPSQIQWLPDNDVTTFRDLLFPKGQLTSLPAFSQAVEQLRPVVTAPYPVLLDGRIRRVITYINGHLDTSFRLDQLSQMAHLSKDRFAHLFTQQVGIPVTHYIRWAKIKKAVESVQAGATLTQAAYEAGFADSAHFSRTFSAMFGMVPSQMQ